MSSVAPIVNGSMIAKSRPAPTHAPRQISTRTDGSGNRRTDGPASHKAVSYMLDLLKRGGYDIPETTEYSMYMWSYFEKFIILMRPENMAFLAYWVAVGRMLK